jgi:hypothetical protein
LRKVILSYTEPENKNTSCKTTPTEARKRPSAKDSIEWSSHKILPD